MKKLLTLIALIILLSPVAAFATPTSWDFANSILQPLQSQWAAQIKGFYFTATSTTQASTFPYASTTAITVGSLAGSGTKCVQADNNGFLSVALNPCGAGGSDPFTHPAPGDSATTSRLLFPYATTTYISATTSSSSNIVASNSATFSFLSTGLTKVTSGVLGLATAGVDYLLNYDAWTHPSAGVSATTSQIRMAGFLSTASSTVDGNLTITGNATATNATTTNSFYTQTLKVNSADGQLGVSVTAQGGNPGNPINVTNQFGTDLFIVDKNGVTTFDTLQVPNANGGNNYIGGYIANSDAKTTLQTGTAGRAPIGTLDLYNNTTPQIAFQKYTIEGGGDRYRIGGYYTDWIDNTAAARTGKVKLTVNDFNAERDILIASTTGSALYVGLADNKFLFSSAGTSSIPYASTTALTVSGSGSAFIVSSGNVGIGTTSPLSKLTTYASQSGLTTIGNARIVALQNSSGATNQLQEIGFGYQSTASNHSQPVVIGHRVTSGSANSMGDLYIATRAVTTDTFPTERLTVTAAGNVGIGSSTPSNILSINSGTSALEVTPTGFLGIGGTTTPMRAISAQVSSASYKPLLVLHNNFSNIADGQGTGIEFYVQGGANAERKAEIRAVSDGNFANNLDLAFWTGGNTAAKNAERFRIKADTGALAVGTTTALYQLTVSTSTAPQLALSVGAGIAQWAFRNAGGNLYFATTTVEGTATTSTAALTLKGSGVPSLQIGSSTPQNTLKNGSLVLGGGGDSAGITGSTTIQMAKIQIDGQNSAGGRVCVFVQGTTLVASSGACNP